MDKIKIIDIVIALAVFVALGVGLFTYKHFRHTASKQVQDTSKIAFQVFLRGVTLTGNENPIKVGDTTFISIRNVPYTNLKIVDVVANSKKILMPNPAKTPAFVIVDDYSQSFMYDIVVTVVDEAKITKDGAVVGGNKIKMGLPITLEGIDYKLNGTVSNVQILLDKKPVNLKEQEKKNKPNILYKQPQDAPKVDSKAQAQPQAQPQPQTQETAKEIKK